MKQKLDHFSYSVDNFEDLLGKSKKFLRLRELESGIQLATGRKLVPNLRHPRATTSPTSTTIAQKITPEKVRGHRKVCTAETRGTLISKATVQNVYSRSNIAQTIGIETYVKVQILNSLNSKNGLVIKNE